MWHHQYIAQAGSELLILLPQLWENWNYRHEIPCLTKSYSNSAVDLLLCVCSWHPSRARAQSAVASIRPIVAALIGICPLNKGVNTPPSQHASLDFPAFLLFLSCLLACFHLFSYFWGRASPCSPSWPSTTKSVYLCLPSSWIQSVYHHIQPLVTAFILWCEGWNHTRSESQSKEIICQWCYEGGFWTQSCCPPSQVTLSNLISLTYGKGARITVIELLQGAPEPVCFPCFLYESVQFQRPHRLPPSDELCPLLTS